jgi:hypothetical protein
MLAILASVGVLVVIGFIFVIGLHTDNKDDSDNDDLD